MKWQDVVLKKKVILGVDRLGNEKISFEKTGRLTKGRLTHWTSEDINIYGRELTKTTRKLITPIKYITNDMVIEINHEIYEIKDIQYLDRFTFLIIRRWRM